MPRKGGPFPKERDGPKTGSGVRLSSGTGTRRTPGRPAPRKNFEKNAPALLTKGVGALYICTGPDRIRVCRISGWSGTILFFEAGRSARTYPQHFCKNRHLFFFRAGDLCTVAEEKKCTFCRQLPTGRTGRPVRKPARHERPGQSGRTFLVRFETLNIKTMASWKHGKRKRRRRSVGQRAASGNSPHVGCV